MRTVLLSDDLVVGVQGHAGSGKTTMLREVAGLLGGRPVLGLAPSAAAARVLEREAGIPSRTLQHFLTRFGDESDPHVLDPGVPDPRAVDSSALARAGEDYSGAVLAVDEASMIDTVRMRELLDTAARLGVARVALVGDTAQLRAVDAGQPFRLLQKAGMRTATMDEVLRQRDPELLHAVAQSREGAPGAAIAPRRQAAFSSASSATVPPASRSRASSPESVSRSRLPEASIRRTLAVRFVGGALRSLTRSRVVDRPRRIRAT